MSPLISLQILVLTLSDKVKAAHRRRLGDHDPEAGLSTLEITIIALGLFLLASVAVLALTNATNTRLNQIN